MSIAHQHRVNTLYAHARSVEERKPAPEIGPIGTLKLKHHEDLRRVTNRHTREANKLEDDQIVRRNHDTIFRNGGGLSEGMVNREKDERKALLAEHQREMQTVKERHRRELEAALKKHGTAP